ncbi:hypothetical protein [Caulobacter sp. S45]|uniref:hypothetical protein n=1 Tax=Caulobacter sp. S45 TaxID=1641861 RepID=UPI001576972B|nr:hypothetical protein [Caulobacter sp. S45]
MADPKPTLRKNAFEEMFDRPVTRPDNDEGMSPTLGEDVSVAHEREEDACNRAHDVQDSEEA